MDLVQEKYFQLLCEIDEICKSNKIGYYLSGRTALCAYVTGEMVGQETTPVVMLKVDDVKKFIKAFIPFIEGT